MKYTCPVCGWPELEEPPENHMICGCCGTQFGYHDANMSHGDLQGAWIARGMPWFDGQPPAGWDPIAQLETAGYPGPLR